MASYGTNRPVRPRRSPPAERRVLSNFLDQVSRIFTRSTKIGSAVGAVAGRVELVGQLGTAISHDPAGHHDVNPIGSQLL
jgi:hypothetical protein